jgi:hypothetical protein
MSLSPCVAIVSRPRFSTSCSGSLCVSTSLMTTGNFTQTHRLNFLQKSSILRVRLVLSSSFDLRQHIVSGLIDLSDFIFFGLGLSLVRVSLKEHIQQSCDFSIWAGLSNRSSTLWAGCRGWVRSARGLGREPFFQTRATEGMEAVEKREWLVEDFCADLLAVSTFAR